MPGPEFDPLVATPEGLKLQAASRPDPNTNPRAFANWRKAMSPPLVFLAGGDATSLFEISVRSRQLQFQTSPDDTQAMSRNWSGAYIRDNEGETYTRIQGLGCAASVSPPPQTSGGDWLPVPPLRHVWLGLDGWSGSISMPQLGTYQEVVVTTATRNPADLVTSVSAWWQWWQIDDNGTQVSIPPSKFPLQVGDLVYVELNVINPGKVRFFLKNLSLGTVFPPFELEQPSAPPTNPNFPATVEGRTAEWIVERQAEAFNTDRLRPFCDWRGPGWLQCRDHNDEPRTDNSLATTIRMAD
jgi:hypothetical protein